jgi:peptidoglycan/LPS O-acetylase OafA/YrhL
VFAPVPMTSTLSLYLDGLRFAAAFAVFLSHYAVGRISGGFFWPVADYGRTSVLVFFVLSGFVIAWVTETRERSLDDYCLARAARLYSVMIPAFIVTAALDYLGGAIDPRLYGPEWGHSTTHPVLGFALSAVFLGESWTLEMLPGFNLPFWSLNYEAWYYALFAAAWFLRGRRRIAAVGGAALLAGPKILVLLPIWLLGVAAWRWRADLPRRLGGPLVVVSLTGFIALEALGGQQLFWHPRTRWLPPSYSPYDYIIGALVALLIVGLANARLPLPGFRFERAVRWLAGASFGLYLLHYPLLNFFGTVIPGPADGAMHRILLFVLTLGAALALARLTEQQKGALKRRLRRGFDAVLAKRSPAALERQEVS